jgi:hypothetical protein
METLVNHPVLPKTAIIAINRAKDLCADFKGFNFYILPEAILAEKPAFRFENENKKEFESFIEYYSKFNNLEPRGYRTKDGKIIYYTIMAVSGMPARRYLL